MFPTVQISLEAVQGIHWFCEGEPDVLEVLRQLVEKIGGIPHTIQAANKALYHCSSVIACNYLNALMDVALTVAEEAGLDRKTAWQALVPLVRSTLTNIDNLGTAGALTGPIERGDVQTVKRHLHALDIANPEIAKIYRVLGNWTAKLAQEKGSLNADDVRQLKNLIAE
jgi:predicted short-subunit dehydrogenase-like oxidoreductase (DUF2520 family)